MVTAPSTSSGATTRLTCEVCTKSPPSTLTVYRMERDLLVLIGINAGGSVVAALVSWFIRKLGDSRAIRTIGYVMGALSVFGLCVLGALAIGQLFQPPDLTPQPAEVKDIAQLEIRHADIPLPPEEQPPPVPQTPGAIRAPVVPAYLVLGDRQRPAPVVCVIDGRGGVDSTVSGALARAVNGTSGGLTKTFIASGAFDHAFEGDADLLHRAGIDKLPELLLGRSSVEYSSQSELSPGLRRAALMVTLRRYRFGPRVETDLVTIRADGAGFSDQAALSTATEHLASQLRSSLP
jgi:hypothetical protein